MIYLIISILICIYWSSMMIAGLIIIENMSEWKSYRAFCMMMIVPVVNTWFVVKYLIERKKIIMKPYYILSWPEIQEFMDHPRWGECIFCDHIKNHPCPDTAYAVPVDLYNEVKEK